MCSININVPLVNGPPNRKSRSQLIETIVHWRAQTLSGISLQKEQCQCLLYYYVPGNIQRTVYKWTLSILKISYNYHLHFTGEQTETQRGKVQWLGRYMAKLTSGRTGIWSQAAYLPSFNYFPTLTFTGKSQNSLLCPVKIYNHL